MKKEEILNDWGSKRIGFGTVIVAILIIVVAYAIISAIISGGSSTKTLTMPPVSQEEMSTAFKLASIEIGHTNPSSVLAEEFESLLGELTRKCLEKSEEKIADYIVRGKEMTEEKGGKTTLLEFGKAMDKSIPEDMAGVVNCAEIAAAIVVLSTQK